MKTALVIGINYVGTEYELRGCINDADDWAKLLGENGFSVGLLSEKQATRNNIMGSMTRLVTGLKSGDVGVITYSGHGTWVPDQDGDEPDGRDEAICPVDMGDDGHNLIIDDELHLIFNKIPAGAHVFFVTDSCSSGTVFRFLHHPSGKRRVRFIPPAHFLKNVNLVYRMTRSFGKSVIRTNAPLPGLVHLSGCRDTEFSSDAEFDDRPNGALTYFAIEALRYTLRQQGTYADAFRRLREDLPSWEYQQTPVLNALPTLKKTRLF